uniref:TLC domain-containing protein n=1 Tax=Neobodo designis TaxID=312471 RepID=A0A7S1PJA9_NEODS|mmetsp:Transcript_10300/g.31850  ORF Transcript_10300/g.31850 Transcript_10300/m.31850 type:complete len:364 (+) Transcript_10300:184-1275(+)
MGFNDDDRNLYALVICVSFALFAIVFVLSWVISNTLVFAKVFQRLDTRLKADWCSRVNSTVHGVVVTVGFVATLAQVTWDSDLRAEYSVHLRNVRCFMCVSLGYFAFDLLVVAGFRVPLFGVFIVHHIVASTPYYMHVFANGGDFGTLVLGSYLCVEIATVFLNVQSWCETIRGHRDSRLYRVLFGLTYASWLISRLFLPLFCLIAWWQFVLLDKDFNEHVPLYCLIVYSICGHGIFIFCYVVFFLVLTPELVQIVRGQDRASRAVSKIQQRKSGRSSVSGSPKPPAGGSEPFPAADEEAGVVEGDEDLNDADTADIHTAEAGGELPAPLHPAELPHLSRETSIAELAEAASSVRAALAAHSI